MPVKQTAVSRNTTLPSARHRQTPHRVAFVVFPQAQILDITGPVEVLRASREFTAPGKRGYTVDLIGPTRGPFATSCGVQLIADRAFSDVSASALRSYRTLLVSGGVGIEALCANAEALQFVRDMARVVPRVASVCTGAFLLAAAGLLNRRRVATHWQHCAELAQRFPKLQVDADAIFVRDGKYWSSAGVTAGMDLALALLEQDLGRDVALRVARSKVMFMMRPGGQAQYSTQLAGQQATDEGFAALARWICENVHARLSVADLADRMGMSERNFARRFVAQLGQPPARFVERARVEAARRDLEQTDKRIEVVAVRCGFNAQERMRRAFHRHLSVSPQDYRARFAMRAARRRQSVGAL